MGRLAELMDNFAGKKILVLGDVMLDKTLHGRSTRISPEGSYPIFEAERTEYSPGGAGNVAINITTLGGRASLLSVVGKDENYKIFASTLPDNRQLPRIFIEDSTRPTTTKTRITTEFGFPILRIDDEKRNPINSKIEKLICTQLHKTQANAIIVSDYAKGLITKKVYDTATLVAKKKGIPLFVDAKPNQIQYTNATLVKFNHKEARAYLSAQNGMPIEKAGELLVKQLASDIIITSGEGGAHIFYKSGKMSKVPTNPRQLANPSGAGDSFISAFTLAYLCKAGLEDSVRIANYAAGVVVEKRNVVPVTAAELKKELNKVN